MEGLGKWEQWDHIGEGRLGVARENRSAPSRWKQLEEKPRTWESEKHRSWILELCHHRWLFAGSIRQVECVWVVGGAA